jgi:hypothetical protein
MREINVVFGELLPPIPGGLTGEHLATVLSVDVRNVLDIWPDTLFSVHAQLPNASVFEVVTPAMADEDGFVRYAFVGLLTELPGILRLMVRAECEGKIAKAYAIDLMIADSIYEEA